MSVCRSFFIFSLALVACGQKGFDEPTPRAAELRGDSSQNSGDPAPANDRSADVPGAGQAGVEPRPSTNPTTVPKIPTTPTSPSLAAAAGDFELPERSFDSPVSTLWATYYYTPRFSHFPQGYDLLDMQGQPLGPRLSHRQWCDAAMEGSVQIFFNGQWTTYNFATSTGAVQVDCSAYFKHQVGRTRFKIARGPFGDGVQRYKLSPFRTIAVDPDVIPYGTAIYIPAARGLPFNLPNGEQRKHDGYFFAADTGGLIHGNHIDVFLGISNKTPFSWITSRSDSRIEYQVVPDTDIRDALLSLHL